MQSEYIRKADAVEETLKYIISSGVSNQSTWNECVRTLADTLQDMPSADAVQVVRCKDCKFYTSMRPDIKTGICDMNVHHMGDDSFCSYGEREE